MGHRGRLEELVLGVHGVGILGDHVILSDLVILEELRIRRSVGIRCHQVILCEADILDHLDILQAISFSLESISPESRKLVILLTHIFT